MRLLCCVLILLIVNYVIAQDFNKKPGISDTRTNLGDWLINGNWDPAFQVTENDRKYEYPGYDGWYNNFARPESGAIDQPLIRRVPNAYADGVYKPSGENRPNPLELSERLLSGDIGTKSKQGRNAFVVFFGQQVVEEILDAQRPACPPEYFNIPIPEGHKYRYLYNHTELPLLRTRYSQNTGFSPNNPRQQINEITPYLDGGLFYGITKQWSDQLRTYENGTIDPNGELASSHFGLFPEINTARLPMANPPPPFHHGHYIKEHETAKVSRFFKLGNPRGNENAFLLTFGVMWFRWHNYLAKRFRFHHPSWSSEKVYNEARKWTIATQQQIVVYDWLPNWVGRQKLEQYSGYNPTIDPQIDQFFQTTAFRFGHTLVVPGVYLRDYTKNKCKTSFNNWKNKAVRTCNIFWRPQDPLLTLDDNNQDLIDIDRLIMGMTSQLSEAEDHRIVEDLRGNVFGPLEFPRRDLMAINIQRARDHGMPDYNTARKAYGLKPMTFEGFREIVENNTIIEELKSLYGQNLNNIDPWVGGIMETTVEGPGELFTAVILDQFRRIRNGDRFWFENYEMNNLFTSEEVQRIKQLTVYDIIMAVTKMDADDIPKNPFRAPILPNDKQLIDKCGFDMTLSIKNNVTYYHLPQLNQAILNEPCKQGSSYDYFSNSEASYILTFTFVSAFLFGTIGFIFLISHLNEKKALLRNFQATETVRKSAMRRSIKHNLSYDIIIAALEWTEKDSIPRRVVIKITENKIELENPSGTLLRVMDFKMNEKIVLYYVSDEPTLIIKSPHKHDMVLKFDTTYLRDQIENKLETLIARLQLKREKITKMPFKSISIVSQKDRQKKLEMFFRVVFAQAFTIKHSTKETLKIDSKIAMDIVSFEMTLQEFADALQMSSNNEFVKKLFALTDKDKNGFVSYREFVDLMIIFSKGDENKKAGLLFKMYDIDNTGLISKTTFIYMIKSFLETCGGNIEQRELEQTVLSMLSEAKLNHKTQLDFEDFKKIIGKEIKTLNSSTLGFKGVKGSIQETTNQEIESIYQDREELIRFQGRRATSSQGQSNAIDKAQEDIITYESSTRSKPNAIVRYIELKALDIFWLSLYTLVLLAIFTERAYYYSVEREHSGLRRIAGYGVTITRGAASAMMFTYSSLLVTMCRNTITFLRSTVANKYFPFDSAIFMHKYIAIWAMVFTIMHIVGHAFNFYHISTQTADDLTCLFRNYFHATHELPKFHYWCWQTMTGFTGIVVTLIWIIMYTFTLPFVRRKIYNWFWYTHNLYPLFFIFMILHGSGRLIQPPFTYYFLLAPLLLFTIDNLISISRKKIAIPVLEAEILPSNVTKLRFKKPHNFQYKAGQWVRIASLALNSSEYHPFTISSCPKEKELTVHIRAVGPWTRLIREVYQNAVPEESLPKIFLDGPFGESHQDWFTYDVSILIGGGIGVTPFASILKDIAYGTEQTQCQKVYFIWVSRTQKQFEWMIDIVREVEANDKRALVSCHIFITQFYEKFDLRTTLVYICEKHYQRFYNKSLFTNLKAVTHFGRPNFKSFFQTVGNLHPNAQRIGIFSCGPPPMTSAVDSACTILNSSSGARLEHHYKNF